MIQENIRIVQDRIAGACRRSGRDPAAVTLIAVSKTFGAAQIAEAGRYGLSDFGENYIQELRAKKEVLAGSDIRWHFIGHLQTNKIRYIAQWVHMIHSVDSVRLSSALSAAGARIGRTIPILVEVNTTGESSKFGCPPEQTPEFTREIRDLPWIRVAGLMTMGPLSENPEAARPAFRLLRGLRDRIREDGLNISHLSMGMTNDFEVAIEEGATHLRIGTAIFGARGPGGH
ncbi:MAG TPA: YggS family pyridoxal phosphate-dependent enzyme [Bacteroidota bacterium]|nr:YggS family pyridoxal phosphate-dependent enzyme [Bacteroidota bacterium]